MEDSRGRYPSPAPPQARGPGRDPHRDMGSFLRENWLWIVTPMVLILVAVAVLIVLEGTGPDSQFHYDLF